MYFFEKDQVPSGFYPELIVHLTDSYFRNPYIVGKHGTAKEVKQVYFRHVLSRLHAKDQNYEAFLRALTDDSAIVHRNEDEAILDVIEKLWERLCGTGEYYDNLDRLVERYLIDEDWIVPEKDGEEHINIYSKSKSELGRLLTNFANTPFDHYEFGKFCSIEGLWYWLLTHKEHDELRTLHGYQAKDRGKALLKKKPYDLPKNFMQDVKSGILEKIEQNEVLKQMLKENFLPLTHYYVFGEPGNQVIRRPREYDWIISYLEMVRCYLQGSAVKLLIAGSRYIPVIEDVFDDLPLLRRYYEKSGYHAVQIISGGAPGVDTVAEQLAEKLAIPFRCYPADWEQYKKSAGYIRNAEMGKACTAALILWNKESKGTANMIEVLKKLEKPHMVVDVEESDYLRKDFLSLK